MRITTAISLEFLKHAYNEEFVTTNIELAVRRTVWDFINAQDILNIENIEMILSVDIIHQNTAHIIASTSYKGMYTINEFYKHLIYSYRKHKKLK